MGGGGAKRLVKKYIDVAAEMANRRPPRRREEGVQRGPTLPASQPAGEAEMEDADAAELGPPAPVQRGRLGSKRGRGASADEPPQARQRQ